MFQKILVPTDGSRLSQKAVTKALALAKLCGGMLVVLHVYPRFASRAVAATLLVGGETMQQAKRAAPGVHEATFVTVEGDKAVDNGAVESLAGLWEHAHVRVARTQFSETLGLNHDVVDPEQVGANVAVTYPVLERWIGP